MEETAMNVQNEQQTEQQTEEKPITRHQCEDMILAMLDEIRKVYRKYNPDGKYLTMTYSITESGRAFLGVSNNYWHGGEDEDHVIYATQTMEV